MQRVPLNWQKKELSPKSGGAPAAAVVASSSSAAAAQAEVPSTVRAASPSTTTATTTAAVSAALVTSGSPALGKQRRCSNGRAGTRSRSPRSPVTGTAHQQQHPQQRPSSPAVTHRSLSGPPAASTTTATPTTTLGTSSVAGKATSGGTRRGTPVTPRLQTPRTALQRAAPTSPVTGTTNATATTTPRRRRLSSPTGTKHNRPVMQSNTTTTTTTGPGQLQRDAGNNRRQFSAVHSALSTATAVTTTGKEKEEAGSRRNSSIGPAGGAPSSPAHVTSFTAVGAGAPSVTFAPTHMQQLQAPPKKTSGDGRGLKTPRDIRRETTSAAVAAHGGGRLSAGAVGGVGLVSASSRAMAPVVHVRVRPLLSYLSETNEQRKVWFLDHENMVVRGPGGTGFGNSVSASYTVSASTVANANSHTTGGTCAGGNSLNASATVGPRLADRRPTLTPSRAGKGSHHHNNNNIPGHNNTASSNTNNASSSSTSHHPQRLQQPQQQQHPTHHARIHSSPTQDPMSMLASASFFARPASEEYATLSILPLAGASGSGVSTTAPALAGSGGGGGGADSRSVSEQSILSDTGASGHTSPGRLSTSSPLALNLMAPSASSSVSGTSTPMPLPRLTTFMSRGGSGSGSGHRAANASTSSAAATAAGSAAATVSGNGATVANPNGSTRTSTNTTPRQEFFGSFATLSARSGPRLSPRPSPRPSQTPSASAGMGASRRGKAGAGKSAAVRRDSRVKDGGRHSGTPGTSTVFGTTEIGAPDVGVGSEQHFNFELIHDESATQEEVFEDSVLHFADEALLAQNVTILCYGPTGSGKTFSMMGSTSTASSAVGAMGPGGGVLSRRASMATGLLLHGGHGGGNAFSASSPSKAARQQLQQQQQQQQQFQAALHTHVMGGSASNTNSNTNGSGGVGSGEPSTPAHGGIVSTAESATLGATGGQTSLSELLEDSIAQVSDDDTEDDEWPLFDHTWYRDRQRRAMLTESGAPGPYGRSGTADTMRTADMGILPRLVRVLLDRRDETVVLSSTETKSMAGTPTTTATTAAKRGASPGTTTTTTTSTATGISTTSATAAAAFSSAAKSARKGLGQPSRRTISLTLGELTFYGIEIYCDELTDLMDPGKRPVTNVSDTGGLAALCGRLNQSREDAVRAATASTAANHQRHAAAVARANTGGGIPIESLEDLRKAYRLARRNRVTALHIKNDTSSRSHAVFILQLGFMLEECTVDVATGEVLHSSTQRVSSYVAMVDLAGSERLKETMVESGQALREAQYINKSLSALSSVVLALYQRSSHIPYRDSKLTRMLRPCLEGGRVLILVHVAPCSGANTLNTLKFADQVRHTMVQTHSFARDANKRGLLDIFEDLIDPEQAKMEVAVANAQQRYDQLCAEVRLAYLSRSARVDSARRASLSYSALLESSVTLTMSRSDSSLQGLLAGDDVEGEHGKDKEKDKAASEEPDAIPPVLTGAAVATAFSEEEGPKTIANGASPPALSPETSPAALRSYKLHTLVDRHFAPLHASEDAGVRAAIHDIELERDRRVEAAKRRLELEVLSLKDAIDEMTKYNSKLAQESASPLPTDPYCQELSKQVRHNTEEVRELQAHNLALQSGVNVLRQRLTAQDDIDAGVDADVEEMKSKGLLPLPVLPSQDPARSENTAATGATATTAAGPDGNGSPSNKNDNDESEGKSLCHAQPPLPPQTNTVTYMDTEVVTDTEMREISYQQVLLAQELSALRMEAVCFEMGDIIWEGLWARAVRQELLTALKVEVALMENVLLDRGVLKALVASASAVISAAAASSMPSLLGDGGEVAAAVSATLLSVPEQGRGSRGGADSTPVSPSAGARRKASPGNRSGRKTGHVSRGLSSPVKKELSPPVPSFAQSTQKVVSEALANIEAYLAEPHAPTSPGSVSDADDYYISSRGRSLATALGGAAATATTAMSATITATTTTTAFGTAGGEDLLFSRDLEGSRRGGGGGAGSPVPSLSNASGNTNTTTSTTTQPAGANNTSNSNVTLVDIPNPLEAAFYHRAFTTATAAAADAFASDSSRKNSGPFDAPTSAINRSSSAATLTIPTSTGPTTAATTIPAGATAGASRTAAAALAATEAMATALTPLTLVGSYEDEEQLQRMAVLKLLMDGVVCEVTCVGDDYDTTAAAFFGNNNNNNTSNVMGGGASSVAPSTVVPSAAAMSSTNAGAYVIALSEAEGESLVGSSRETAANSYARHPNPNPSTGGDRRSPDEEREPAALSSTSRTSHRGSNADDSMVTTPTKKPRLPTTKHWGRLRLVRKVTKTSGSTGRTTKKNVPPPITLDSAAATDLALEDGAFYCLEFIYSNHGIPLPPRVAEAVTTAVTPSPRTQLEELVDSLPSSMDVRRAYSPLPGHSVALSSAAAALVKERRLFSIPLNEPQLSMDLHLLEAGVTGAAVTIVGSSATTATPTASGPSVLPATAQDSPRLTAARDSPPPPLLLQLPSPTVGTESPRSVSVTAAKSPSGPLPLQDAEAAAQIAIELRGIPRSSHNTLAQHHLQQQQQQQQQQTTAQRLHLYQQYAGLSQQLGSSATGGEDASSGAVGASSITSPSGKDVVLAKRLREGGELLLPSPCIVPNKGSCTLLLRFLGNSVAPSTRLENIEAIVAALCGVMPPAVVPNTNTTNNVNNVNGNGTPQMTSVSPTKARASRRSPPAELSLAIPQEEALGRGPWDKLQTHPSGMGSNSSSVPTATSVTCVYPHVPHVLLFPLKPSGAGSATDVTAAAAKGRDISPEPHPPRGGGGGQKKAAGSSGRNRSKSAGSASAGAGAGAGGAVGGWRGDALGGVGDAVVVRGTALRVHLHFPGTLTDNKIDLATLIDATAAAMDFGEVPVPGADVNSSGGLVLARVGPVAHSILQAAALLQSQRTLTIGPFLGDDGEEDVHHNFHNQNDNGDGDDAVVSGGAIVDRSGWRVARRLQQLHAFHRNIRSLIKQQIFEAEDIKGDMTQNAGEGVGGVGGGGHGGCQLREVAQDAREAVGVQIGGTGGVGGGGGLNEGTFTRGTASLMATPGRGGLPNHPLQPYGTASMEGGLGTVKREIPLSLARELAGTVLPWTLWQWAYRWPAVAALSQQLERAALTAATADHGPTPLQLQHTRPRTPVPEHVVHSPLLASAMTASLLGFASPLLQSMQTALGTGLPGSRANSNNIGGGGDGGLPMLSPSVEGFAAVLADDSPLLPASNLPSTGAGGGLNDSVPASPWSAVAEGSLGLEPIMLPSDSEEDDLFNTFGHGNWMAESAVASGGTAAKTVWMPEMVLTPAPDYLTGLAMPH